MDGERTLGPDEASAPSDRELHSLGRYVVLRPIGSGGMGAVYIAYDPELDRKVALKLLHGETSPQRRRALLMEAQAMAKLAHPNVAAVHDVGEHEQAVYMAMELVEGVTLRAWLADERRSWRQILEPFIEAGRGLEAAHARGLIHRDFKPDNVMISKAGRAVVLDFGLARPTRGAASQGIDDESLSGAVLAEATVGRVSGTPAYMAPEQSMASELTAAVDQFAFCVSLWEALYGERPFEGPTYARMLANISDGRVRRPRSKRRAPRWLERCLLRGLRPDAEQRWASMTRLLSALERGRDRWRWQVGMVGVLTAAVPLGVGVERDRRREREHEKRVAACTAEGEAILEVWNDGARARLRSGLLATGASFAEDSVATLTPWLDDYAETWKNGRFEVCLHTTVDGDWSNDESERALWCLEDRQLQLEATVDQISAGDAKAARRAVRLASYLDPVEPCLDVKLLEGLPAPPRELRDEIRGVRARLIETDRLRHRGHQAEALEEATAARTLAEDLGWPPLRASARFTEGRCLFEADRLAEADLVLTDAYFDATTVGSIEVAFRAARSLVTVNNAHRRFREAMIWSRHADAVAKDKVDPGRLDEAEGHYVLATTHAGLGDEAARLEAAEHALELRTQTLGESHPITAAAQGELASAYVQQGRSEDALRLARQAHDTWLEAVGPAHPRTVGAAERCMETALALGRPQEALPYAERNVAVYENPDANNESRLGDAVYRLGLVYQEARRFRDAAHAFERATAIFKDVYGTESRRVVAGLIHTCNALRKRGLHDLATSKCEEATEVAQGLSRNREEALAWALESLASVRLSLGRPDEALALRLDALAKREAALGSKHAALVVPLGVLGDAQVLTDRRDEARDSYQRALDIGDETMGAEDKRLVRPLCGLSEVLLSSEGETGALALARRAAAISERRYIRPPLSSRATFALARALDADDGPSDEARALARRAREGYASVDWASKVDEIDAWLADR